MEEEKKTEQVKDKTIVVTAVELESNPNNQEEISRVRFKADIGDITWKPRVEKVEFVDGLKKISRVPITMESIPEILKLIGRTIQNKGSIKFDQVSYMVMVAKDAEGTEQKYRFINSEKVLTKWRIVEMPKEEVVASE